MATFRDLGSELLVRATRGICAGSLLNADSGRAVTAARIEEWAGVLSLYEPQLSLVESRNDSAPVRATA
ncbi:hypothetical protein [Kribbella sp. NPDC006257]|jgi:hypothetical protein|uniref:hypothetical protein n=1 Tax=Kribbella sp. NPDC006257 TaxID=3156738 RepID=UPI0033B3A541